MNYIRQVILIFVFLNLYFLSVEIYCQDSASSFEQTYDLIQTKYGLDQVFVNGIYFENIYKNDIGNPFFLGDDFHSGYIVIHDIKYSDLLFMYNIFNQSLAVQYTSRKGEQIVFMPPTDFISEFSLNDLVFRKYQFPGSSIQFFQEVYNGNLKCLYAWHKNREESYHSGRYMTFEFFKAKRKSYLVINDKLHQYKSQASYMKLFPKENKKDISAFLKRNNINIGKSSDQKIAELVSYCENLIVNSSSTSLANKEYK